MKKLIAIAVVFVLVAGVAFAADVSGELIGMTNIVSGDSTEDSKVQAGGWPGGLRRARAYAGGQNEEGTFGGWFRFETYGPGNPNFHGNAWWKPIDQFKLMLGVNPDGDYAKDGVARWGFYQVAGDTEVVNEHWAFGASFYDGWSQNGAELTLTPIENLQIFFGVPFSNGGEAKDSFGNFHAQVAYDISGIGNLALTYKGGLGDSLTANQRKNTAGGNGSTLLLYFGLSAIENLGVDIGLGYTLPVTADKIKVTSPDPTDPSKDQTALVTLSENATYSAPIAIGLGLKYDGGAFGVKTRFQVQLGETFKAKDLFGVDDELKGDTVIDFDILPYFAVNDSLTVLLSAGLKITSPADNEKITSQKPGDAVTGWHVEPYVTVKSSWWAPNFYMGFRLESDGVKGTDASGKETDPVVKWFVPIGIVFSF